jgi:hypothetical protein
MNWVILGDGIAQSSQQNGTSWTAGVSIPGRGKRLFVFHSVQTGSETHQASYPMGTGGDFSGGKAAGAWSWPLPSGAEVKNGGDITSLPHMTSRRCA